MSDGVEDGGRFLIIVLSRKGVCHDVFQSRDVGDVGCELADERQLVSLPIRDGVAGLEKRTRSVASGP